MREIRFRAWHEYQMRMYSAEEMSEDQMALLPDGRFCNVHGGDKTKSTFPKLVPLQFTGLLDKSGREIYEGDILSLGDIAGVVVYREASFCLDSGATGQLASVLHGDRSKLYEVIGNIYENPELVKK